MDVRRKKWVTYFLVFCMTLSVLTGIDPTSFLVHAETGPHKPVVTSDTVKFSITTPGAYAVYLSGELNKWNEKDPEFELSQKEGDLWEITLTRSRYEELAKNKSAYKFVTYTEENGIAHLEEGENHQAYLEGFELAKKELNIQPGESIQLPSGVYYNEQQQKEEEIATQDMEYSIEGSIEGVSIKDGQLKVTESCKESKITIKGKYKGRESVLNVICEKSNILGSVLNAYMDNANEVIVNLSTQPQVIDDFVLKDDSGQSIDTDVTKIGEKRLKLTVKDESPIDVSKLYTVGSPSFKAGSVTMRGILDDARYYYNGNDLGLTYGKSQSTFKVWAPTATEVKVAIYDTPEQSEGVETSMTRTSTGVWELNLLGDQAGKYYLYAVSFADGKTNYAVDPYAKAVSVNGQKAAIVDLSVTNPGGFDPEAGPRAQNATDAVIYEVNVRDFSSQADNGFNESYRGKYLAFTQKGLQTKEGNKIGIDHLKELGITHVQIQPIFDYATVDETKETLEPDNYNWGYDPQNFNAPEGSYATDPSNPTCRIEEAKQMIQALHNEGIGVIMDVVYNHTYNITDNPFNLVVPGYYYRSDADMKYTNGSGCGNEVASERPMVRKFIKDSTKYWATEYGIDGFRFDLMGLIDTETMKQVTKMLQDEVNQNIIVYGEPWTAGTSGLVFERQTSKGSQKYTDFSVFNDDIRQAIKGDSDGDGKGFATGSTGQEKDIIEGVQGAIGTIAANPKEVVTYVTTHDNLTLWDKVLATMHADATNPYQTLDMDNVLTNEAVKRDLLANGIVFTSQGISFMHAGAEILRTKHGNDNSYKGPDETNQIVWQDKDRFKPVFDYYEGLIALRKAHPAFRMATSDLVKTHFETYQAENNVVAFGLKDYANGDSWKNIVVIYNASKEDKEVNLPQSANWKVVVNEEEAGTETLEVLENANSVKVAPLSMKVLYDTANEYIPEPTTLVIEEQEIGMAVNQKKVLIVNVKDQNGALMSNQIVKYNSTDEGVVTIESGKLVAHKVGQATVSIECGNAKAELKVQVVAALNPSKIVLSGSETYVYETKTLQLTALIYDQFEKELLGKKVKWSTSDKNIASVDAYGKVTGISEGQATITATVDGISESYTVDVKPYKKRYIVLEYIREDKDYTDWNLWTWDTGITDGQVDFTVKDNKATALIEIGPDTESVGFILRRGIDWSTCKQDIPDERYIAMPKDQVITKAKIYAMKKEITQLEEESKPEFIPGQKQMIFNYRNNELFSPDQMNPIKKVTLELNGQNYDMVYDESNDRFTYTYNDLQEGKYYYCYHVTMNDDTVKTYLDKQNKNIENDLSVIEYKAEIKPTPGPTSEPTPGPTPEPTPEPTPGPTSGPTSEPTPGPTQNPTSNSSSSSSGGGGGASTSKEPTPSKDQMPSKDLESVPVSNNIQSEEALTVISVSTDYTAKIEEAKVSDLIKEEKTLVIASEKVSLEIAPTALRQLTNTTEANKKAEVQVALVPISETKLESIQAKVSEKGELSAVAGAKTWLSLDVTKMATKENTESKITSFNEPLILNFDLKEAKVVDPSKLTLVKYVEKPDGTVEVVKLGGKFNPETGIFSAYIGEPGNYGVMVATDLKKVNLQIGNTEIIVNDRAKSNDVAPKVINGTTVVPLRFIAENLGAEVKWDSTTKQAIITLDGKTVNVGEKEGGINQNGRIVVPLRYISENLGAHVLWIPSSKSIEIVK